MGAMTDAMIPVTTHTMMPTTMHAMIPTDKACNDARNDTHDGGCMAYMIIDVVMV